MCTLPGCQAVLLAECARGACSQGFGDSAAGGGDDDPMGMGAFDPLMGGFDPLGGGGGGGTAARGPLVGANASASARGFDPLDGGGGAGADLAEYTSNSTCSTFVFGAR